jgi:hypothetical protein
MNLVPTSAPVHYASAARTLLRFAVVMIFVGLIAGVLFQESSKKLDYAAVGAGARLEAVLSLALVHGHVLLTGTLIPIALAGAAYLGLRCGGSELSRASLAWLTRVYLPCAAAALALMLYKGYHVLLSVRFGERDFDRIDAELFGGLVGLRHAVYALSHVGMALGLGVFAVALWRSLRRA